MDTELRELVNRFFIDNNDVARDVLASYLEQRGDARAKKIREVRYNALGMFDEAIPAEIRDESWRSAFSFACGTPIDGTCDSGLPTQLPPGDVAHASGFTPYDVKRVIAHVDGANDESNWAGVFELHDGRFAFLSAGCDYTGWD
jgi:hypothetical protein